MGETETRCCVCLDIHKNSQKIIDPIPTNEQLILKLRNVVPEVEWQEDYRICQTCLNQLDMAYKFRHDCIQVDYRRKGALVPEPQNPVYMCYHCNGSFTDKSVLIKHIECHHNDDNTNDPRPCGNCNRLYSNEKLLKAHTKRCLRMKTCKTRPRNKRFSCEQCSLVLKQAKLIVEHCVKDHQMDPKAVKPFICEECPMRFTSSTNLIQHRKYHKGSRSHVCSLCGKSYITKSDLTVHEYTHYNRRNYKCDACDKAFNTNKNLRSHKLVVHTDRSLWKFSCERCERKFPLKSGFEQQMKRHTGHKEFSCCVCGKSFVSRSEVKKHLGFHSKVKPFKCEHCEKMFREKRVWEAHLAKEHGVGEVEERVRAKGFACEVCGGRFVDGGRLERHLRTHLVVKPFGCERCDRKFSGKGYLKQHMKMAHDVAP